MDAWLERLRESFAAVMPGEEDRAAVFANLAYAVSREALAGHRVPPPPRAPSSPEGRGEREARVVELIRKGVPEALVAERTGLHRSTVYRIKRRNAA